MLSVTNQMRIPLDFILATSIGNGRNVFHNNLGGFRFSSARFTRYHDAGISVSLLDGAVCGIGNCKDVRRILKQFAT